MKKWISAYALVPISIILSGCSSSPLKKLEGKWTTGGSIDEYHSWYLEYRFKGNSYELIGYPPLSENGRMKVKETRGDSILVEFMVKKSSPVYGDHEEWIYITGNTLALGGNIFTKTNESKMNK